VFDNSVVASAIKSLKLHKAAVASFFTPELLKFFAKDPNESFLTCMTTLFNIFAVRGIPLSWNELQITSLFKGGDQGLPTNYRGISVMKCLPKCFSVALNELLTEAADAANIRAPTQSGFRKHYRVEDNAVILRTIMEKCAYLKSTTYFMFIDMRKAYDSVNRAKLWESLTTLLPDSHDLLAVIKQLYIKLSAFLKGDINSDLARILI
jgi:hypothetical protein